MFNPTKKNRPIDHDWRLRMICGMPVGSRQPTVRLAKTSIIDKTRPSGDVGEIRYPHLNRSRHELPTTSVMPFWRVN